MLGSLPVALSKMAGVGLVGLFSCNVSGRDVFVTPDLVQQLRPGDIVELYIKWTDGSVSDPAVVVLAKVEEDTFAGHLVAAASLDLQTGYDACGDPIFFYLAADMANAGFIEGAVGAVALEIIGNARYPVALRLEWLGPDLVPEVQKIIARLYSELETAPAVWPSPPF